MEIETPRLENDGKGEPELHPALLRIVEALAVADVRRDYDAAVAEMAKKRRAEGVSPNP